MAGSNFSIEINGIGSRAQTLLELVFWWHVKWPLLAAPLASALAIGFAVSVAQYLATQFIGAGRHATVTTEAVTLASGGQRTLAAALALLQALLPATAFALAARVHRRYDQPPRRLRRRPPKGEPPAWDGPARPTIRR